jgi:hypothetical protein
VSVNVVNRRIIMTPALASGGGGLGLQTNLSAFFSLDDTSDATGNVSNLTNNNGATFVPGIVGNCVNLVSASSQNLFHVAVSALQVGAVDFSIQCWFNAISSLAGNILDRSNGVFGQREYWLDIEFSGANKFGFNLIASSGSSQVLLANSFGGVSASNWYHVVFTFNNTTKAMTIYVNTVSDTTTFTAGGTVVGNTNSDFIIGNGVNGLVDQVGIWKNRILSPSDVSLLYNGGAGLSYAAMA